MPQQPQSSHMNTLFSRIGWNRTARSANSNTQLGRSMTEMLGVLALVGVLSIAAIFGYSYAINKYKSNTTIKDLELRAVSLSSGLEKKPRPLTAGQILLQELGDKTSLGYQTESFVSANNPAYFEIEVLNVQTDVCRQILKDYTVPTLIFANDKAYKGDVSVCGAAKTVPTMNFVYPIDLGGKSPCSDKGFFDENALVCKCSGNTYFNPFTQDCSCPAGHIWSEVLKTCVESICPEGQFESATNGCVSCEDEKSYLVLKDTLHHQLCEACPNRYVAKNYSYCALKKCEEGVSYPEERGQFCNLCDSTRTWEFLDRSDYAQSMCNACPNRHAAGFCTLNTPCPEGTFFATSNGTRGCFPCNASIPDNMPDKSDILYDLCRSCKNAAGQQNREIINGSCEKILCDVGEFKGANGACYGCDITKGINVKSDSGCEESTCNREIINNVCVPPNCPEGTHIRTANGSCYPCDQQTEFSSTQAECEGRCTNVERRWTSYGLCKLNTCTKGVNFPFVSSGAWCYPCAGWEDGSGASGTSDWGREYCEACGNYVVNGDCINSNSCKRGSEFRSVLYSSYRFCVSCDTPGSVRMDDHSLTREMCTDCTSSRRFFANNYCYRCDSGETPTVSTSEEISACNACGVRTVKDGKCVLTQ